jgi:ABC-type multidrug transport system fused ATPase/permease subunit
MWSQVKEALAQSTARFLTRFASLLPGLVAVVVALLISLIVAWILAAVVRRLLSSMQFDERLAHWGFPSVAEWSPLKSPTLLVSRAIGALVILTGLLIGIAAIDADWTSQLARSIVAYIPNLLGAALVLLIGSVVARFLARSVLIGAVNLNLHYARLLSLGVKWMVVVLAVAMALEHLRIAPGIVKLAFGILFGGIVFTLALAVGLGSKDLVTKSLERDVQKVSADNVEEPFRHI